MVNIRIKDLPIGPGPVASDFVAIDQGTTRKATVEQVVDTGVPAASQSEAQTGTNNFKRMTPLSTKQSIASEVGNTIASISQGNLADSAVQPSRQLIAGDGLIGGGNLSSDRTFNVGGGFGIAVSADGIALDTTTQTRLLISGGSASQVLQKNSSSDYDVSWATVAAATAVSYGIQSLSAAQQNQARTNIGAALRGQIFGLTLSNNTTDAVNDIDIAVGEAASTESNPVLMVLASALTKRLDANWAVGTGNGGLDTGSIANTTYHVWLIQRSDTGVVDSLFSTSATSPTMPANYDRKRRIGSVIRSAGTILGFQQIGNLFSLNSGVVDRSSSSPITDLLQTLTIPTGIRVSPLFTVAIGATAAGTNAIVYIGNGDRATAIQRIAQATVSSAAAIGSLAKVYSNLTAQIRVTLDISSGSISGFTLTTYGWIEDFQ